MSTLFALSPVSLFGPGLVDQLGLSGNCEDEAKLMVRQHSADNALGSRVEATKAPRLMDESAFLHRWVEVDDALSKRMGALDLAGSVRTSAYDPTELPSAEQLYQLGGGGSEGMYKGRVTAGRNDAAELDATAPSTPSPLMSRMPARLEPAAATGRAPSPPFSPRAPAAAPFALKLLVSNSMAGTVIGKAGARISEIKAECDADIKVTPNGRFFPGTHERVVLVLGEPVAVQAACARVVSTIFNAADPSLDVTQRLLIPDAAAGLVIGPNGARISELRELAGLSSVHVATRDMATVPSERPVTLQGPLHTVVHALALLVDRLLEDPVSSRFHNLSTIYRGQERRTCGPAGPCMPPQQQQMHQHHHMQVPPPQQQHQQQAASSHGHSHSIGCIPSYSSQQQQHYGSGSGSSGELREGYQAAPPAIHKSLSSSPPRLGRSSHGHEFESPMMRPMQQQQQLQAPMHGSAPAMMQQQQRQSHYQERPLQQQQQHQLSVGSSNSGMRSVGGSPPPRMSPPLLGESPPRMPSSGPQDGSSPVPPDQTSAILPIPDLEVGMIVGKGGATVRELQQLSGARILISKRGEYLTGTKCRIVTFEGPAMAVQMAQYLVLRKIEMEKEKLC